MIYFALLIIVFALGLSVVWFFMPAQVVRMLDALMRRKAGLRVRRVTVDGLTWPYLEGGPADAPVLVLVHGFGDRKEAWVFLAQHLTGRYRVICPDLPGFGENTKDPALGYGTATQAARLHGFVQALGLGDVHLSGSSMGGMIALHYALAYPQTLASLTLYDAAGVSAARPSQLAEALERGENPLLLETPDDVDRMLAFSLFHPIKLPRPVKQVMFAASKSNAALFGQIFETIHAEPLLDDRLGDIHTPTLVIWGREDRLIDVSCADALAKGIPHARKLILDETGHVPMVERPADCASAQIALIEQP